jgi:hypothetical protein
MRVYESNLTACFHEDESSDVRDIRFKGRAGQIGETEDGARGHFFQNNDGHGDGEVLVAAMSDFGA